MQRARIISVLSAAIAITVAARCEVANAAATVEREYFYTVSGADGATEIKEMTSKQATRAKADLQNEHKNAVSKRAKLKRQWTKAFPGVQFPVPEPKLPRVQRLGRVPTKARQLERDTNRHNRRLEMYSVCLLKDGDGQLTVEVVRQDKLHGKISTLRTEYVEAALAWAKANPGKRLSAAQAKNEEQAPGKPKLSVNRRGITSNAMAEKHKAALEKRIESAEKKKSAKPPRPEPESEPDPDPPAEEAEEE